MHTTITRRLLIAGAAAIALAGPAGHAAASQSDDFPGLSRRTFTSNFFDHELTWSRDWEFDLAISSVNTEARRENIILRDATVDEDDSPPTIVLGLTATDESFSVEEFIDNLPHGSIDSPNYPPNAFVFGEGINDRGAWFVWGWEPDDDDGNAVLVQYLFPQEVGDPLISLGVMIKGQHVEKDLIERIEDEVEFDGGSVFLLEDHEEIWDAIAEVF